MEYPHYPYNSFAKREYEDKSASKKFKPKIIVYLGIALSAALHYFVGFEFFSYIAWGFLLYALWKLFSCGCWKSQMRTMAALLFLALSMGILWKPIFSLGIAIMAFEMFV